MDVKPGSIKIDTDSDENLILRQAIKDKNWRYIKSQLKNGMNAYAPVITKGPFAGFTILHLACMEEKDSEVVVNLMNFYKADVNVMADDGVLPIHLACFFNPRYVENLARSSKGLNTNATITKELFVKYVKDKEWCPDFGDEMTLLTYAVIYEDNVLGSDLTSHGANVDITSLTKQPLIIYALDNRLYDTCNEMVRVFIQNSNASIFNYRDDDGVPLSHYQLHPKWFGKFRYGPLDGSLFDKGTLVSTILAASDKYALINDYPATFLPNLAAYRGCPNILLSILHLYESIAQSKALYYATLPIDENADNYLRILPGEDKEFCLNRLRDNREKCLKVIIIDLMSRIAFGSPVPEEEKKIMENLIATDTNIKNLVEYHENKFLNGALKKNVIEVNDKLISMFDLHMQLCNRRKMKLLAKSIEVDYSFIMNVHKMFLRDFDNWKVDDFYIVESFMNSFFIRLDDVQYRIQLLEILEEEAQLREVIPLPYELVLDMIEYLNNIELDRFLVALQYP